MRDFLDEVFAMELLGEVLEVEVVVKLPFGVAGISVLRLLLELMVVVVVVVVLVVMPKFAALLFFLPILVIPLESTLLTMRIISMGIFLCYRYV
jgi:hypothetical protein